MDTSKVSCVAVEVSASRPPDALARSSVTIMAYDSLRTTDETCSQTSLSLRSSALGRRAQSLAGLHRAPRRETRREVGERLPAGERRRNVERRLPAAGRYKDNAVSSHLRVYGVLLSGKIVKSCRLSGKGGLQRNDGGRSAHPQQGRKGGKEEVRRPGQPRKRWEGAL